MQVVQNFCGFFELNSEQIRNIISPTCSFSKVVDPHFSLVIIETMGAKSLEERAERAARPWFKKKRYIFPISFFSFFFLIGVLTDPPADENYGYQGEDTESSGSISSPSSNENADGQNPTDENSDDETEGAEAPLPELEIVEGLMPSYIGYSATQVLETLEELEVSENDVRWPPLLDP